VAQTNIAAAVSAGLSEAFLPAIPSLPALPALSIPSLPISLPRISISLPSAGRVGLGIAGSTTSQMPMMPSLTLAPGLSIATDTSWLIEAIGGGELPIEAAVEIILGTQEPVASEPLVPVAQAPAPRLDVPTQEGRGRAPVERRRAGVESTVVSWAGGSPEPAVVARRARGGDAPPRQRPAPSWKPSAATYAPAAAPSGTSASAAGAGGSSGGGLPIFLALPFIAAVLDLARRVALERATWPSGHRRRIPDTPG
jgi:hypothetical protein